MRAFNGTEPELMQDARNKFIRAPFASNHAAVRPEHDGTNPDSADRP